ncbi:hypothetical protein QNH23_00045 [Siminovitchia fortis]|uniref:Prepilin-type N-terminal cleavage/methylation domain-containing protein n=1 Tax=Siminovitchia fortis TaxID=254758 RepID=A0A443IUV6_9BACI|nr:hypothetical protein [Siminovitchia fortis]RWR11860.1 hypothetical protein D4N35_007940 [Siminovitchia fortis]WHY81860.1 hypothetical protein QNH23_00045 [Siminovitchia fortis]
MRKLLNNGKGLTLVEVLAVFVIGVIVLILMTGVVTSIQKQYKKQSSETGNLFEETYAAKVITKDVREAVSGKVWISSDGKSLEIKKVDETTKYFFHEPAKTIEKNGVPLSKNIKKFCVSLPDDDPCSNELEEMNLIEVDQFKLTIISLSDKKLETIITIRSGDNDEEAETK